VQYNFSPKTLLDRFGFSQPGEKLVTGLLQGVLGAVFVLNEKKQLQFLVNFSIHLATSIKILGKKFWIFKCLL